MDSIFFWLSKIVWALASPGSLLVISVMAIWLLLKSGAHRPARYLAGLLALLLFLIALLPVGEWLLHPLESRFANNLPEHVDGIIVLGGYIDPVKSAAWNQIEVIATAERQFKFLELARHYPQAKLAFTGGTGSLAHQEYKEAAWAEKFFAQQGMDLTRVVFERDSRNTYENAVFSKQLLAPQPGETWLLITTAWHMPRSLGVFCKAGFPVIPYPVDHWTVRGSLLRMEWDLAANLSELDTALKEWIGLVVYRVTGKTPRLLPKDCDSYAVTSPQ